MLQPATPRQTGADVHCGFNSQRCVIKECPAALFIFPFLLFFLFFFLSWAHADLYFVPSLCRLQQDIQSVSGQRAVTKKGGTSPSTLHPHRCIAHTDTARTKPYTHVRIVTNWTQCLNLTVSTKSLQARKYKWERPHSCETINIRRSCELANGEAVLFLYVGYYVLVYLQGFFLHCVNTRQQEMLCHSLFFSGGQKIFFLFCTNQVRAVCCSGFISFPHLAVFVLFVFFFPF